MAPVCSLALKINLLIFLQRCCVLVSLCYVLHHAWMKERSLGMYSICIWLLCRKKKNAIHGNCFRKLFCTHLIKILITILRKSHFWQLPFELDSIRSQRKPSRQCLPLLFVLTVPAKMDCVIHQCIQWRFHYCMVSHGWTGADSRDDWVAVTDHQQLSWSSSGEGMWWCGDLAGWRREGFYTDDREECRSGYAGGSATIINTSDRLGNSSLETTTAIFISHNFCYSLL